MNRTGGHLRMLPAALLLLLALAGCSQPEIRYQREDFPFGLLLSERVATGGFVLGARAGEDPTTGPGADRTLPDEVRQSWAWTPHLETALLVQAPGMDRWSFASVADQIEPERLAVPLRLVARGGVLAAAELEPLAADLPGVRFLLVGRLVRNELSLESRDASSGGMQRNPTGLGKFGSDADTRPLERASYSLRREVTVGLELYDLTGARSVWSAEVAVSGNRLLDPENGPEKPQVRVESDPEAVGGIRIEGQGGLQGGPELEPLLDQACSRLTAELLALARPADGAAAGD